MYQVLTYYLSLDDEKEKKERTKLIDYLFFFFVFR